MRVMIFVTHLLGTGHLSRAATLARSFVARGHQVDLISGGTPVTNLDYEGINLHQLAPVKSDGINFTRLLDGSGNTVDQDYLAQRRANVDDLVQKIAPDVLITELYPFGRRVLRHEFQTAIKSAQNLPHKAIILCSIRDILAPPSNPEKAVKTDRIIAQYFDSVLVHSDPTKTPLNVSWPVTETLAPKLCYTGFVAPPAPTPHPGKIGQNQVLVTAGGGGVGYELFKTAVEAAKIDHRHWRLLVGGDDARTKIDKLRQLAGDTSITIEPTRSDFRQMLPNAAATVAMCGYNTAMDLLQTGTPAVFVPFDAGGEQEQTLRANSLAASQQFSVISSNEVSPKTLLDALMTVQRVAPPAPVAFDGANETVRMVEGMTL
jgi:predicted glycosyltransferase